ncbi:hypothetical protein [Halovenus amylolytica]
MARPTGTGEMAGSTRTETAVTGAFIVARPIQLGGGPWIEQPTLDD